MKRIALMFALFFAVALIFPANAPADPICGDGVLCNGWTLNCDEECDPGPPQDYGILDPGGACPGECMEDCTCPPEPICGDGILDPGEECDGDAGDCATVCLDDCTCEEPPGTCEPRTQGFWKRVCVGVYGFKLTHPETPENFDDPELCADLMARGEFFDPCVRSASQIAALKLNSKYGMLDDSCKVYFEDMETTVEKVLAEIDALNGEDCKAAADLAEAINSRDAL